MEERILTTHAPKLLFEFGANLPHQRLSIVKIFCLISVSHSMREQKQQRGRNFLPLKPVVSTSFIIYPKQRVGFAPDSLSFWKSPDSQVSWRPSRSNRLQFLFNWAYKVLNVPIPDVVSHQSVITASLSFSLSPSCENPSRQCSTHPLLTFAPSFTV